MLIVDVEDMMYAFIQMYRPSPDEEGEVAEQRTKSTSE